MSYKTHIKQVKGKKNKNIFVFALSTCMWCMKTKELLRSLGVEFQYVDVDLLDNSDRNEVELELRRKNTDMSFPKIFINKNIIDGFDEDEIKQALR